MIEKLLIGFGFGIAIGVMAWRVRALTRNGALAASITGGMIFGLGGLPWAVLLLTFFVSSSALSRAFARKKATLGEKFAKGSNRDWGQVLANGGLGAALAILGAFYPEAQWPWIAFSGAMAAVNADTWATELGVLSAKPPHLLFRRKVVERGTSGGVTRLGDLAAFAGALTIGLVGSLFADRGSLLGFVGLVSLAGFLGAQFDSLLGATIQGIYWCPTCEKDTERHPMHTCGEGTVHVRGWRWLNNDLVNLAASAVGALLVLLGWIATLD
jgi:uncharacterized protein (TIGR00297 family)